MNDHSILINELQTALDRGSTKKIQDWWERYLKGSAKFRGINLVDIREVLKEWIDENKLSSQPIESQLKLSINLLKQEYSEDKLAGILYLQDYLVNKSLAEQIIDEIEKVFIEGFIFDWNICDWLCVRVIGPIIKNDSLSAIRISNWCTTANLWQARASIVSFINLINKKSNPTAETVDLILNSCAQLIKREERFAKTAVGWLLRELSKVEKEKVISFINSNIDSFSKKVLNNTQKYL